MYQGKKMYQEEKKVSNLFHPYHHHQYHVTRTEGKEKKDKKKEGRKESPAVNLRPPP